MFSLDWSWESKAGFTDVNFSETPEHKCAHIFKMDEGNYFAYPNNRIIWYDDAWVFNRISSNPGYLIDLNPYSVENKRKVSTSDEYMYEVKQARDTDEYFWKTFEEWTTDEDDTLIGCDTYDDICLRDEEFIDPNESS